MSELTVTLVPTYTLTVVTPDEQRIVCTTTSEALALAFVEAMRAVLSAVQPTITLEERAEYIGGYSNVEEIVTRLGGSA